MLEHAEEDLRGLLDSLAQGIPQSHRSFEKVVADFVGEQLSSDVARLLLSLSFLRRSMNIDGPTLLRSLEKSFDQMEDGESWNTEQRLQWDTKKNLLVDLLLADNFVTFEKAVSLSYDYPRFLERSCVLTDVRPAFSNDAERVQAITISHTLQLSYRKRGSGHMREIEFALDERDLKNLIRACQRALAKGRAARAFATGTGVPAVKIREDEEES